MESYARRPQEQWRWEVRPDQIETLEAWANNWDEGPKALTLALIADWRKRGERIAELEAREDDAYQHGLERDLLD